MSAEPLQHNSFFFARNEEAEGEVEKEGEREDICGEGLCEKFPLIYREL